MCVYVIMYIYIYIYIYIYTHIYARPSGAQKRGLYVYILWAHNPVCVKTHLCTVDLNKCIDYVCQMF